MKIKIIAVNVDSAKSAKGKDYTFVEVTYKNLDFQGKVESKKHNEFGNKDVFSTLKNAQANEVYDIVREKDQNGYWQWIGINSASEEGATNTVNTAKTTGGATVAPKSNYETAEERAKKQVYIVRQSSLTNAISTLKTDKKNPTAEEVINLAQKYEAYVFGLEQTLPVDAIEVHVEDEDIPL